MAAKKFEKISIQGDLMDSARARRAVEAFVCRETDDEEALDNPAFAG